MAQEVTIFLKEGPSPKSSDWVRRALMRGVSKRAKVTLREVEKATSWIEGVENTIPTVKHGG